MKSAQNQFPVITQAERMADRGNLWKRLIAEERESSSAQIRTLLNEQRKNDYRRVLRKSFSSRIPCSSRQNKNAEFYRENYCDNNRIFVKFINKIL